MTQFHPSLHLSNPEGPRQVHYVSGQALWQWQKAAKQQAIAADVPCGEVDWLLREVTSLDSLALRLETYQTQAALPSQLSLLELDSLWQQRLEHRVPLQYLLGAAPWRHFWLKVSPAVLIPRPETEEMIDLAIAAVRQSPDAALEQGHWADLGTGSGAIALGLAEALPTATIHAVDVSAEALAVAQENAARYDLASRIQFYQGSWFEPLRSLQGQLSGIVSNPPYIPSQTVCTLQPEVMRHEPHLALDGGSDGLDCIRHLVSIAPEYLRSGGIWLIEMMAGQAASVVALLEAQNAYGGIEVFYDLAGLERFVLARRR